MIRRSAAAVAVAAGAVAALALPAAAHVTIPEPAEAGGFGIVTFSVPNERDDAGTVEVSVRLPEDHPFGFVSVQPKPGWDVETTTRALDEPIEFFGAQLTEVTDTVTWSGGPIAPGEFDTFSLSIGPMPEEAGSLEFPTVQVYEGGEEVAWDQPTPEGGEEPELPAPVLEVVAAPEAEAGGDDDDGADALAMAALVVAVAAALLAGAALLASRRPSART